MNAQTAPAAATPQPQLTATVRTDGVKRLHVRAGPGTRYAIVDRLHNGEVYPAVGRDTSNKWVQIALTGGRTGWVSAAFVALNGPITALPEVAAPPLPVAPTVPSTPTPAAARPALPPLAGKLAVPVFDATRRTYDVYLVNADGTNLRRVVAAASAPALSADGGQLAYHHWQIDDRGLVVAASDGSGALRLTDKLEDTLPSFSPDGKKLVFSSYREGDRQSRLYYVWTDEANLRAWEWGAGGMFGVDPFWMSDGHIVYRSVWPPDELWVRTATVRIRAALCGPGCAGAGSVAQRPRGCLYVKRGGQLGHLRAGCRQQPGAPADRSPGQRRAAGLVA